MNITLLGPPCSGKGSQASLLSRSFNITHISIGEIFRTHISEKTTIGLEAQELTMAGKLVPNNLIFKVLTDKFNNINLNNGFVFDGFPRNIEQALEFENIMKEYNSTLDAVFVIELSKTYILERAQCRLTCTQCGAVFNSNSINISRLKVCNICKRPLERRLDDAETSVIERINAYNEHIEVIKKFYESKRLLYLIDGTRNIDEIYKDISFKLGK